MPSTTLVPNTRTLNPFFSEVRIITRLPRSQAAAAEMRRLIYLIEPTMRRWNFRVPRLIEYYPSDPAEEFVYGVNTNHGEKIEVRLRHASHPEDFRHEDEIVVSLLHELCHITHFNHTPQFYEMFEAAMEEYENACETRNWNGRRGVGGDYWMNFEMSRLIQGNRTCERR